MYQFFALPTSLLLLLAASPPASSVQDLQWPYNIPPGDVRLYYPEDDEPLIRRDVEIGRRLMYERPKGVRKMSDDEGEKFFMEDWLFEIEPEIPILNRTAEIELAMKQRSRAGIIGDGSDLGPDSTNVSLRRAPLPAFRFHSGDVKNGGEFQLFGRHLRLPRALERRDFQCPAGTSPCTDIERPNSCCADGETCQIITDTGLGDVGCCADGASCSGELARGCSDGLTSCPQDPGGGCCIPGYQCLEEGCVFISTATVVVMPSPSSTQSSSTTPPPPTTSSTTTSAAPAPTTSSSQTTPRPSACTSGSRSCPSSLGGACCPTDSICGSNSQCLPSSSTSPSPTSTTTTASVEPPFRRTSSGPPSSESTIPGASCPTGFYACIAYYRGGCCRTGRDCNTTSCPPTGSTTVVNTNGVTAVAPTGSGISANNRIPTGSCADAWSTCAASVGGGCCPPGYACGQVCTATASGGSGTVGKSAPSGAEGKRIKKGQMLINVISIGLCMLLV